MLGSRVPTEGEEGLRLAITTSRGGEGSGVSGGGFRAMLWSRFDRGQTRLAALVERWGG